MAALKIENGRLEWLRFNQATLRADLYKNLKDAVHLGDGVPGPDQAQVGKLIVLPSTYIGSARDMQQRYHDAMAIVRKFGKPDLFITMTCNPKWEEIERELYDGMSAQDRADLTARVFKSKLEELLDEIEKKGIVGRRVASMYVIEFQVSCLSPSTRSQFTFRDSEFNVCFNSNVALLILYLSLLRYDSILMSFRVSHSQFAFRDSVFDVLSYFTVALLIS
jgi:hypothetical protein